MARPTDLTLGRARQMHRLWSMLLPLLALSSTGSDVWAAPPPNHPSPAAAMEMLKPGASHQRAASVHVAKVINSLDANEYTYIEVHEGDRQHWIAGPRLTVSPGELITFDKGVVITDFYSKLLQRTFPSVMFVARITRTRAEQ